MDITINTPALFFPALSLVMLAYTNRFLALAGVVRNLHAKYNNEGNNASIHGQIKNLRYRLRLVRNMQAYGVASFLFCIFSMFFIYINKITTANIVFALAMVSLVISLVISFIEISLSTKALELELSDIENLDDPSIVNYIKKKFDRH